MKISTRGRYALRLMIDLAMNQEGDPVRCGDETGYFGKISGTDCVGVS